MSVLITLTTAGANTGPFSLYSNVDNYVTAVETGLTRAQLVAGYTSTLLSQYTSTVLVKSTGTCPRSLYLDVSGAPTSTTTTTSSTSSTSSTTTTTTTSSVLCLTGDTTAIATCGGGESALFTVGAGHTALITPNGYYNSGSGTRTYTAYIMNAANTTVLYTFYYVQTTSAPGNWSSTFPDANILPAGSYRLRTDTVDCFTKSGSFTLIATCNS